MGLHAGHRHRVHARLRRPVDRARCWTAPASSSTTASSATTTPCSSATRPPSTASTRPRSHAALRRLNRIHGHYDIPERRVPLRPRHHHRRPGELDQEYGWRRLDPHELAAIAQVTTRFGELMGIKDLPTTYDGYLRAAASTTSAEQFAYTPASHAARRGHDPDRAARSRRAPLRAAAPAGHDRADGRAAARGARHAAPARVVRPRGATLGLRLRAPALRFAPPAPHAVRPPPDDVPPRLPRSADLGPASMLDELEPHDAPDRRQPHIDLSAAVHSTSRSTRTSARPSRAFLEQGGRPPPRAVGEGRHRRPRGLGARPASQGLLGFDVAEEYGGAGVTTSATTWSSPRRSTRAGASGAGLPAAHRHHRALPHQPRRPTSRSSAGCPGCVSGELITAIAMTEPGAGSDLQGIRTTAVDDGDHYVLNGSKTFITNGINADLVDRGRRDRPRRRPPGHQPARRRARHGGLRARPQPRQDRPARPGHRRAVLRRRRGAQGEPARRGGRGLRLPDGRTCPRSGCRSPSIGGRRVRARRSS